MDETIDTVDTGAETSVDESLPAGPASAAEAIDQGLGYAEPPAAEQPEVGADGKPVEKPVLGADGKPVEKSVADGKATDKKAPDYTAPAGLSPDATRRFQALVGDNKTVRAENEQLKQQAQQFHQVTADVKEFQGIFEDAKCMPEQFSLGMDYIKAVNTGNFDHAGTILMEQLRLLSLATGKDFNTPDPLREFPDLAAEVSQNQITRQRALELARSRAQEATAKQGQQRAQQQQQQVQAFQRQIDDGGRAVAKWCGDMKAKDIDWPAKEKLLIKEIDWIAENVEPSKWIQHLEKFYQMVTVTPAAAPRPQPLRSNGGAGGVKAAPGSMLEAISGGLGYKET